MVSENGTVELSKEPEKQTYRMDVPLDVLEVESVKQLLDPSYGGSENLFFNLTRIYLQEMPERLYLLGKAISDDDYVAMEHQAHKIRGGAAYFGAQVIVEVARKIESLAEAKVSLKDGEIVKKLDEAFLKSVDEIQTVRNIVSRS